MMFLVGGVTGLLLGFLVPSDRLSAGWSSPLWPPLLHLIISCTWKCLRCVKLHTHSSCYALLPLGGNCSSSNLRSFSSRTQRMCFFFCFFFPITSSWTPNHTTTMKLALSKQRVCLCALALTSTLYTKIVPSDQKALCMIGHGVM